MIWQICVRPTRMRVRPFSGLHVLFGDGQGEKSQPCDFERKGQKLRQPQSARPKLSKGFRLHIGNKGMCWILLGQFKIRWRLL